MTAMKAHNGSGGGRTDKSGGGGGGGGDKTCEGACERPLPSVVARVFARKR